MKKKQNNIAHISNLILMALVDNDFDENEKKIIIKTAVKLGIESKDIRSSISVDKLKLEIPESIIDRIEHLYQLVEVLKADEREEEEETAYFEKILNSYGFHISNIKSDIEIDTNYLKKQLSVKKFLEKFELFTGEKLSPIVVDSNFKISFPLYSDKKLKIGPLPKCLYIFFLLSETPISMEELFSDTNRKRLKDIYALMPDSVLNVDEIIDSLTDAQGEKFNINRSIIKRAIKDVLPSDNPRILEQYDITGARAQKKGVKLPKSLIEIIPNIPF